MSLLRPRLEPPDGPSLEPPDEPPPECTWCDGDKRVVVTQVLTVNGLRPVSTRWAMYHEVDCPNCIDNPGVEPAPDPRDDPRVDDRIKERRYGGG